MTTTTTADSWYEKNDVAHTDFRVIHKSIFKSPREGLELVGALVASTEQEGKAPDTTGKRRERKSVLPASVWNDAMLNLELEAGIFLESREKQSRGATSSNQQRVKSTLTYYGTSSVIFNHGVSTKIRVRIRYYLTYLRDPQTNQPMDVQRAGVTLTKGFLELKVKSPRAYEENSVDKYRILVSDELIAKLVTMDPHAETFKEDLKELQEKAKKELDDDSQDAMVDAMFNVMGTEAVKHPGFIRPSMVISYERNAYKYIEKDYPLPVLDKEKHPYHNKCLVQYLAKSLSHSFHRSNTSGSTGTGGGDGDNNDCSISKLFKRSTKGSAVRESTKNWEDTNHDHIGLTLSDTVSQSAISELSEGVQETEKGHHGHTHRSKSPVRTVIKGVKKLFHHGHHHQHEDSNHPNQNVDSSGKEKAVDDVTEATETTNTSIPEEKPAVESSMKGQHNLDIEYQFTVDHNVKARYPLLPKAGETKMPVVEHFDPANATELMRYPSTARVVEFKEPLVVATLPHKYQSVKHQALNDILATRMQKKIMWGDYDANVGKYGTFRRRLMEAHHTNRIVNENVAIDFSGKETFWVLEPEEMESKEFLIT